MLKSTMSTSDKAKNPYVRAKWLALGSMAGLAALLNMVLRDWIASLHLAVVIVFTLITLGLAAHALIVAVANRSGRNGRDPGGPGGGPGGSGGPGRGPTGPQCAQMLGHPDDFGLAA